MNSVSILVMFEESTKRREEEKRKAKELEMVSKVEQLQELEELVAEAKAEAEKLKDELKKEMYERNIEEMQVGKYIVRWTETLSQRFDTTAFKKAFPSVYANFTKHVSSRRFSISG